MPSFIDEKLELQKIDMTDLRAIIHALKMATFTFVEEDASVEIRELIKRLPSPEQVNQLGELPSGLVDVRETVGYILGLIDTYGQRGSEFKARYKAKTKLPPRYKVMEWKRNKASNGRSEMRKEAVDLVKQLVRISSNVDKDGHGRLSGDLIIIAKAVRNEANEDTIKRLNGAVQSLRLAGFNAEAEALLKEAGFWSGVGDVAKGIGQGVQKGVQKAVDYGKSVGQGVQQGVQKAVDYGKGIGQGIKETYQVGNLKGTFQNVDRELDKALDYAEKAYSSIQDPNKKQKAGDMLAKLKNMKMVGKEVYNLVIEDEQAAQAPTQAPTQAPVNQSPNDQSPLENEETPSVTEPRTPTGQPQAQPQNQQNTMTVPQLTNAIKTMEQKLKNNYFTKGETQESVTQKLNQLKQEQQARTTVNSSNVFNLKRHSSKS